MQIKLKESQFYRRSYIYHKDDEKYLTALNNHRGEWVNVETERLFNNQYNITLDGCGIRVFDDDITAVKDDARKNAVTCGYCGKTFPNMDEYKKHVSENIGKAKKDCINCFWYRSHIADTIRTSEKTTAENGDVIETNTTKYVWRKSCTYDKDNENRCECTLLECANEKYCHVFTPENTYFLKYPNGYDGYFRGLSFDDKMRELKFEKIDDTHYIKRGFVGSYDFTLELTADKTINNVILANSRKHYVLTDEIIKEWLKEYTCLHWFCQNHNILKDFPKTHERELSKKLDAIRDRIKHADYISEFLHF